MPDDRVRREGHPVAVTLPAIAEVAILAGRAREGRIETADALERVPGNARLLELKNSAAAPARNTR
jgi:hypothetical protein